MSGLPERVKMLGLLYLVPEEIRPFQTQFPPKSFIETFVESFVTTGTLFQNRNRLSHPGTFI